MSKMIKKSTIDDHLKDKPIWVIDVFNQLHNRLKKLDKVYEKVTQPYIGYKFKENDKRAKLFVEIHVQKNKLELHLKKIDYKIINNIVIREVPDSHKWTLSKLVDINEESNLEDIMNLIKQSYKEVIY